MIATINLRRYNKSLIFPTAMKLSNATNFNTKKRHEENPIMPFCFKTLALLNVNLIILRSMVRVQCMCELQALD